MSILNFAHGQMFMIGGFMVYYVYGIWGCRSCVALAASGVTLMAVGALFERFFFRPVSAARAREESSMLLAVGIAFLLEAVVLLLFGEKQRGVPQIVNGVFLSDRVILPYDRVTGRRGGSR